MPCYSGNVNITTRRELFLKMYVESQKHSYRTQFLPKRLQTLFTSAEKEAAK